MVAVRETIENKAAPALNYDTQQVGVFLTRPKTRMQTRPYPRGVRTPALDPTSLEERLAPAGTVGRFRLAANGNF